MAYTISVLVALAIIGFAGYAVFEEKKNGMKLTFAGGLLFAFFAYMILSQIK